MKQHIVEEVDGALRAGELLMARLRLVRNALQSMSPDKGRKNYIKAIVSHLDDDVNLVTLRVNNAKEKLIKHDLV